MRYGNKLVQASSGSLPVLVAVVDKKDVLIDFTKPLSWLIFTPEEVRGFAQMLLKKADEAEEEATTNGDIPAIPGS